MSDQIQSPKISPLAKWLAAAISATVVTMGICTVVTRFYYGQTTKLGGAVVTAEGRPAVFMGIGLIAFGLFPLAFWARTPRCAGLWASVCMLSGVVMMLGALYF